MKRTSLLLALALLLASPLAAQQAPGIIHLPSARLDEAIVEAAAAPPAPVHALTLERRDDHASIIVRRTENGMAELHEEFDDLYIVHQGAAVLLSGGTYDGARTTAPGELQGGAIDGGSRQALAPGDVAVVPAGIPHQVLVEPGKSIIYHVVKIRRGK